MDLQISKPLRLQCGLILQNRLVKAAMAECFGGEGHLPNRRECLDAYEQWAKGGWGLIITGNVQVDPTQRGDPHDFVLNRSPQVPEATELAALKAWSRACSVNGSKTIVQICHPGRQVAFAKETLAPSAVPMNFGTGLVPRLLNHLVFGTPRAMSNGEIQTTIRHFAEASRKISRAGFAGVELHGAHGYLLAQFLSSQANVRTDAYGGHPQGRARIVVEIIRAIRAVVPADFCIGLKLNSVDVGSPTALMECMEQLQIITDENIDFLEISGGSFEDPTFSTGPAGEVEMLQGKKASTVAREAFFLEFAEMTRARFPHVPLMVTGGFRSRCGMEAALVAGSCDLIGLARPAVMSPHLPRDLIMNTEICEAEAIQRVTRIKPTRLANVLGIKLIGVGPERDWYTQQIHRLGRRKVTEQAAMGTLKAIGDRATNGYDRTWKMALALALTFWIFKQFY